MADPHWFQFEPSHPFLNHAIAVLYLILFNVCVTGNLMVIGIFLKYDMPMVTFCDQSYAEKPPSASLPTTWSRPWPAPTSA